MRKGPKNEVDGFVNPAKWSDRTDMATNVITRVWLAITVLFFLGLRIPLPEAAQAASGPKSVLKENSHDFGKVWEGANLEHTFEILNQGDEILKINSVTTD